MTYNLRVTDGLLKTKLYIPHLRPNLVPRPALVERLNQGLYLGHKLTFISAPAGFGKTTLISTWIAGQERPSTWLSLDKGDEDPTRFLTYLVAALQAIDADVGTRALAALQSPQPPSTLSTMTVLLNEIAGIRDSFILVLDDYHVIDAQAVDDALTFLLDHLPPQMHLVITTREDPNLPLARYRARGQMTELRANDLRFTAAEAADFLNVAMGLDLTDQEIAALEKRTEGWIAGLQMAALSMQGRADSAAFIQAFTGSHRFVLDYLVEEVLRQQPAEVRSFLLKTSILDRLSGPLCDAVWADASATTSGQGMLVALERGNLFLVSLDDQRQWYRYHHLFADVLQARLAEEQPALLTVLHSRASEWYARNGLQADAIGHALAAGDLVRAAELIELAWPEMDGMFQANTWLGWARELPDELVRARPVLSVAYAWAVVGGGDLETAEARLHDAEQWLATGMGQDATMMETAVADHDQFSALPASIASAHAFIAQAYGDVPATITFAQQALDLLPQDDYVRRGPAASILGLAYWGRGELEAAHQALSDAMDGFHKAGSIPFAISGTYGLADIRVAQGRLRAAIRTYERAMQIVAETGSSALPGTAELYLGLSMLHREQGDDEAAARSLARSLELGEEAALGDWMYRVRIAQARLREDQGDLEGALALLNEAERFYYRTPVPSVRPIAALKARLWIRQGRLPEAQAWANAQGLSTGDALSYLREFEHLTLARLLLARHEQAGSADATEEALQLLERLRDAAEAGGWMGSVIEILLLQALVHHARGDMASALEPLEQALGLAEPEGYVRIFVDEGEAMVDLLETAVQTSPAKNYVRRLLAAYEHTPGSAPNAQPLADPLSERELDVLRLLATDLSGPQIARELTIALSTMRTHTRNIYSKLGANSRRTAVRRAEELDLL